MAHTPKQEIVTGMLDLCTSWLSSGYKPGDGRDQLKQIHRHWQTAWDAGLVQDKSLSIDNMTELVASAFMQRNGLDSAPLKLQELLEQISLVWFAWTFAAEQ